MKKKITKKLKISKMYKINHLLLFVGIVFIVSIIQLIFKSANKISVNQIIEEPIVLSTCGVKDFAILQLCPDGNIKQYSYTCHSALSAQTVSALTCMTLDDVYKVASDKCSNTCQSILTKSPTPSSLPSMTPKPTASLAPGCKILRSCVTPVCPKSQICPQSQEICKENIVCTTQQAETSEICAQETGTCISASTKVCSSYVDSCQKAKICDTPLVPCSLQQKI